MGWCWQAQPDEDIVNDAIELIVQTLAEDEGWQGDLTDTERTALLNAATLRFQAVLVAERARLLVLFREIGKTVSKGDNRDETFNNVLMHFGL